jgi:branched-subunit amino acid transport protein AzlD
LLADLGRWMPLGAVAILACYCLSRIDPTAPGHGVPQVVGLVVTVAVHWWRRSTVLSLVSGTAACVLLANGLLPGFG